VRFINDTYAGANGSIPDVTRWVEGATMFDAVERTSRVRRLLMDNFDERAIQPGEPMHLLNMRFAHVYLHHRYSLEGLVKYVGGMDFRFAMRGDGQVPTTVIPSSQQRRALGMALDALNPAELAVPARISAMIPPAPPGMGGDMTWIPGNAGTAFDPITLAGGLATEVMGYLLDRERVARLVIFKAQDPGALGFDEVLDTLMARTWRSSASTRYPAIQRAVERSALDALLDLAGDVRAMPEVRAIASMHLQQLDEYLEDALDDATGTRDAAYAHKLAARVDIERFLDGEDVPASRSRFPVLPLPWP
jgi:hypothetical protein